MYDTSRSLNGKENFYKKTECVCNIRLKDDI